MSEEKTYQPALDTHKISLGMVIDRIEKQGNELFLQSPSEEMQLFWQKYTAISEKYDALGQVMIDEL